MIKMIRIGFQHLYGWVRVGLGGILFMGGRFVLIRVVIDMMITIL